MWRWLVAVLCIPGIAYADEAPGPFTSTGIMLSYGSRGLALGIESSGGIAQGRFHEAPKYLGVAVGFDVALAPGDRPRMRVYAEVEGGLVLFGLGGGGSLLFGGKQQLVIAPHVTTSLSIAANPNCYGHGPFFVTGAYYRYTAGGLHEVGTYGKAAWAFDAKPTVEYCDDGQ